MTEGSCACSTRVLGFESDFITQDEVDGMGVDPGFGDSDVALRCRRALGEGRGPALLTVYGLLSVPLPHYRLMLGRKHSTMLFLDVSRMMVQTAKIPGPDYSCNVVLIGAPSASLMRMNDHAAPSSS